RLENCFMLTPIQAADLLASLGALSERPRALTPILNALAADKAPNEGNLAAHVRTAEQSDPVLNRLRYLLVAWDASDGDWAIGSTRNTAERRKCIYDALAIGQALRDVLSERLPFAPLERPVLISDVFEPWYTEDVRIRQDFYWRHYRD